MISDGERRGNWGLREFHWLENTAVTALSSFVKRWNRQQPCVSLSTERDVRRPSGLHMVYVEFVKRTRDDVEVFVWKGLQLGR
jgi:hypothetical protein